MTTAVDRVDAEARRIAAGVHDMYDAFLARDQERFDSHLSRSATMWESHFDHLYTMRELDEFRDRREDAGERPVLETMRAEILAIDVWGDTALVRYLLITAEAGQEAETTRVTEVLRLEGGRWLIVHHHAQLRDRPEGPTPVRGSAG
ncbi:nuclear transport factor 2 family protein [Leucobacter sp. CSA1]|uniref:Nuclear transport factor 2 family protein n=1 Tax=Leucobacter chromiisoli TaxID=2796471 RepID=A0A934Q5Z2_9MICO|nr:nuclear transport factor 2 family protein [Leucobacter chromiisoli]MBK0417492.1 nuclear transport factor 2 family protein [Leucobacter chromiisoli]